MEPKLRMQQLVRALSGREALDGRMKGDGNDAWTMSK